MLCFVLGLWLVVDRSGFFSVYELGAEKMESGWCFLPSRQLEQLILVPKCLKLHFAMLAPWGSSGLERLPCAALPQARPAPPQARPWFSVFPKGRSLLAQLALISLSLGHFFVFICPCLCFLANKCHAFPTGFSLTSLYFNPV